MTPMQDEVLATAQRLQQQGQACALVTVLRVQAPASARPGDKAVATAEGICAGWIGGGCAQPAVVKTVRQVLADGRARLIRISPAADGEVRELGDVLAFGMACHSGGTLELFVDPLLPAARLVVLGDSPVALALAGLAPRVGFAVTVVAPGADAHPLPDVDQVLTDDDPATVAAQVAPGAFVVVATQGRRDLPGLRAALALRARQVSLVASARKAQVLKAALVEAGHDAAAVAAIVAPAGQPIGAQTPQEIALSVLAAVVAARRGRAEPAAGEAEAANHAPQAAVVSTSPAPVPRPPRPLPLPDLPPVAGSCCGGGGTAALAAAAMPTAPVATGSCCGGA